MTDDSSFADTTGSEWVCGISGNKIHQGYLLSGFMLLSGLALMFYFNDASEDAASIGMVNIAFAAIVLFMVRRTAANSSRLLVLNRDGVWFRDWKGPVIPWTQIAAVNLSGSRIKSSVHILLKDSDAVVALLDPANRAAFEKNPLITLPVLKIPDGSLAEPPERIQEKITAFAKRARNAS